MESGIFPVSGYILKTRPGPIAKNATLGLLAGGRTRDFANLVRRSANRATEAVAESVKFAWSWVRFPARGPKVAFFATG